MYQEVYACSKCGRGWLPDAPQSNHIGAESPCCTAPLVRFPYRPVMDTQTITVEVPAP